MGLLGLGLGRKELNSLPHYCLRRICMTPNKTNRRPVLKLTDLEKYHI